MQYYYKGNDRKRPGCRCMTACFLLWRKYMKENDNLAKNIALCKEIEGMLYKVYIHFDESAKEDMKDKIKKLLIKEIS